MRERPASRVLALGFLAALVLQCLVLGAHYAGAPLPWPSWLDWLYNAIQFQVAIALAWRGVTHRPERAAWLALSGAVASFSAADVYYTVALLKLPEVPIPSLSDVGYLGFYPLAYAGLVLLLRSRSRGMRVSGWLDGLIAGLAMAAAGTTLLYPALMGAMGGEPLPTAVNLAYPIGDALLLVVVTWAVTVVGLRSGATWLLIAVGLFVFAVIDSIYLVSIAKGTYVDEGLLDVGWPGAMVLLAAAAWLPRERRAHRSAEGWGVLVVPAVSGVVAVALLVRDHYVPVASASVWLGAACLLAVLLRLGLTFGENIRMLQASRDEASTDALTGLGNRRRLFDDLAATVEGRQQSVLALYDLDGFKAYNDAFGHAAGDVLLERLGAQAKRAVGADASVYRVGGDEFCLLTSGCGDPHEIAARAAEALAERGDGFTVGCSYGVVELPEEAGSAERALQLADERMYAAKGAGRLSAGDQSKRVLLRAVHERDPGLAHHVDGVADMAVAVARRMGLGGHAIEAVGHAAELHDIGKIAVPDSILHKPGPLDEDEWAFMRRHTLIGERIVASAPALDTAAALVRSSHERYDGAGYPDRLAGEAIPLGARIIAVCDSWDAMVSDRSYRAALSEAEARAELERCSGSQFDPSVVDAFLAVLGEVRAARVAA